MIEVINIHKTFENKTVLKSISATFEKGKTNLVIGRSGSGKTVLMKILLGICKSTEGDILFDGISYNEVSDAKKTSLRRNIGVVFQGSALFDFLSVKENIMFPLKTLTNKPNSIMEDMVNEILKRVNLPEDTGRKKPNELSGGMQKRVAIARAVIMKPKYLFCDEPNSGLDPKTSIVIDELIYGITKEYNITTVINTHDMNSVMEIGDKIILLQNGDKVWEGSKNNLFSIDNEKAKDFIFSSPLAKEALRNRFP